MDLTKINTLNGPVSCYILSYQGKIYLLFGDVHSKHKLCKNCHQPGCVYISDFLHNFFNTTKTRIDFFLEEFLPSKNVDITEMKAVQKYSSPSPLEDLREEFKQCLVKEKQNCEFKNTNIRIHYSDPRTIDDRTSHGYSLIDLFFHTAQFRKVSPRRGLFDLFISKYLMEQDDSILDIINIFTQQDTATRFVFNIIGLQDDLEMETLMKRMIRMAKDRYELISEYTIDTRPKIKKQINNCPWPEKLINFISAEIQRYLPAFIERYGNAIASWKPLKKYGPTQLYLSEYINIGFITLLAPTHDLYTIARMFHPKLQDSDLIIGYFGIYHVLTIHRFLTRVLKAQTLYEFCDEACVIKNDVVDSKWSEAIRYFSPNYYLPSQCMPFQPIAKFLQIF